MTTPRKPRPQPDPTAILWLPEEAAAALHTSVAEVERQRERGLLRGVRVGNGPWRYRPADVRAYVHQLAGGDARPAARFIDTIPTTVTTVPKRRKAG